MNVLGILGLFLSVGYTLSSSVFVGFYRVVGVFQAADEGRTGVWARAHRLSSANPLDECSASRGVPSATTHNIVEGQVTRVPLSSTVRPCAPLS